MKQSHEDNTKNIKFSYYANCHCLNRRKTIRKRSLDSLRIIHSGITLTFTVAKGHNACLVNHIRTEVEKFLRKNLEKISEKLIDNFSNSDYTSNHRRSTCKKSRGNTIVCRFLQGI